MTTDVPLLHGRVRAVVSTGDAGTDEALRARLRLLELPAAHVEVVPAEHTGGSHRDLERLTSGRVDHVLLVTGAAEAFDEAVVADALAVLRSDLTTAAVGPTVTGAPTGSVELAVSGHLLLVRAAVLRAAGGFDPTADGVLDDLDLCARLWLTGHRVRSVSTGPREMRGQGADLHALRAATVGVLAAVLDDEDVTAAPWREPSAAAALAGAAARRRRLAPDRRRGSGELVPLLHRWVRAWVDGGGPAAVHDVVGSLGAPDRAGSRRRVLVITADVLAPAMAGPAIRATAIARALVAEHEVRLVTTARCDLHLDDVEVAHADDQALEQHGAWADVIVFQGWLMVGRPWLRDTGKVVVVDIYDPMHLEQLEQGHEADGERGRVHAVRGATATLNEQMLRADLLLCASGKQRDLWLGALASLGRVNPVTYDEDPSLAGLIEVAPFGVVEQPFEPGPGALRGVVPGIGPDDRIVLWGGGVYNWFDPLTLVRAVDALRERVPGIRLYFLGMGHPNPEVPSMRMAAEVRALAGELGLIGSHVFFNEGWVRFDDRVGYLRDADVGVSTHLDHIETEFSFRTRILDYLWAGLPVVATGGDVFAELLERHEAGLTVPAGDVDALVDALAAVLLDPAVAARCRAGSQALAGELRWSRTLEPLVRFCRSPRRAADVACPTFDPWPDVTEPVTGLRRDLRVALEYLRSGDAAELGARLVGRVRRRRGASAS